MAPSLLTRLHHAKRVKKKYRSRQKPLLIAYIHHILQARVPILHQLEHARVLVIFVDLAENVQGFRCDVGEGGFEGGEEGGGVGGVDGHFDVDGEAGVGRVCHFFFIFFFLRQRFEDGGRKSLRFQASGGFSDPFDGMLLVAGPGVKLLYVRVIFIFSFLTLHF